jgi:hypothetical protein
VLALAAVFDDPLARWLRCVAWPVAPVLALVAGAAYPWMAPGLRDSTLDAYLALLLVVSIGQWERQKEVNLLTATAATLAANLLAHGRHVYALLEQSILAGGLPWLAGGLAVVLLALGISLLKMGVWRPCWRGLIFLNAALGGAGDKPA